MQTASKIILGIDPGTILMGYGLLSIEGKKMEMLDMNACRFSNKLNGYQKLEQIHEIIHNLINRYKPNYFAIEAPFFGKNVQSMLKLGRAQGVAIAAAIQAGLPVAEYSPKKIKQSITGNGNADKLQVMHMLQQLLKFGDKPAYLDASDALAVALCHHFQQDIPQGLVSANKSSDWKKFLLDNPSRIRQ
ncbi:MAG: crossover junction endodeoxyribonuclease RuvC [Chitinophagaceae bacterium]|mgnify:CR=1 FL=1|nr:crossover junction endodeoxyribonuclease RuvC [Bacteroidota bacterium]MCC6258441.1 crossover junction endodeoxyribonuclease RuvC [Chitinophagaceae bacterium]MCW5916562.1 crossover junction endodeoxyribonuclease RuvC [Ferruginibacter sp.]